MKTNVRIKGGQPLNKKAFTLIELLAVIVILAIIALIATPIILGIINDAKKQSGDRSAELYLDAAKKAIARYQANNPDVDFSNVTYCDIKNDGKLACNGIDDDIPVEMSGQKPNNGGKVLLSKGNVTKVENLNLGEKYYNTDENNKLVASDTPIESQTLTGTIYRISTETIAIGDSIKEELSSYETEVANLNIEVGEFYLKHEVEDDIVQSSYICFKYSASEEDACIQGGVPSAYGSFNGMIEDMESVSEVTGAVGNVAEIAKTQDYFLLDENGICSFQDRDSNCDGFGINFIAMSDGTSAIAGNGIMCMVTSDGTAYCGDF